MATAIQRRRGTAAQHSSFTGLAGEITIDTTNNTVRVHDGSTAGGHRLAKYSEITSLGEGDITAIVAGTGLTGDATSGDATLNVVGGYGITANANDIELSNSEVRALFSGSGDISYNSTSGAFSFTNDAGDIEGVTAGDGLSGGGTSGTVSLALDLNELTAATVNVANDSIVLIDADDSNGSKKESIADLVSAIAGSGLSASSGQLSITETGDISSVVAGAGLTGGGTSGDVTLNAVGGYGITVNANDVEVTNADVRGLFTGTDAGGDGSFAYNSSTGVFTYTGPSAAEVQAHISAGTGINISSGEISTNDSAIVITALSGFDSDKYIDHTGVTLTAGDGLSGGGTIAASRTFAVDSSVVRTTGDQSVAGDKTFSENVVVQGNLTVSGNTTTLNTETLTVEDNIIVLNSGTSGAPSENAGIQVDRGSSSDVYINWDESNDKWQFTNDGSTYYNMLTETDVEGFFSASDAGGDGSFSYSNGVFTYTGPSASEVRAHFSGGTGIDISSGSITFDGSELSTSTTDGDGDFFVVVDSSDASRKLTKGSINISGFNNDSGFTTNVGDITGVTAGTGLSGGGASGAVTLNVSGLTVSELHADTLQTSGESFSNDDTSLMTSAAIEDKILSYGYTTAVGDITSVVAGAGLTGGASSGDATVNVVGGYGITANANDIEVANADIRGLFSASGDISYNSSTGAFSFTNDAGDIEGVTAGDGLTGGGTSGSVTINIGAGNLIDVQADQVDVDLSELTDMTGSVDGAADEMVLLDNGAQRRKLFNEIGLSVFSNDSGFTTNVGDITGVTAGSGMTGGGSSGGVTLNVIGGDGITANSDDMAVDLTDTAVFTSTNTASKAVVRDGSGDFAAGTITATATQAQYADLAEKYSADADYEAGTVVVFGGDAEVTECVDAVDHKVAGVISTDPAYMMNSDADGLYIALAGRVPCKVTGSVEKGALLVTSDVPGHAMQALQVEAGRIIGKAIQSKEGEGEGVIEVLVNMM